MSFLKLRLLLQACTFILTHIFLRTLGYIYYVQSVIYCFTNKPMNQSSVGAFPEPYVSSTIPFKPGIPKIADNTASLIPETFYYHIIV
jgi:hypothetical protein